METHHGLGLHGQKILWRDGVKNFGMERDGVKNFGTGGDGTRRKNLGRVRCLAAFTNSSMRSGLLRAFPPFLLLKAVTCKQAFVQFFHGTKKFGTGRDGTNNFGTERDGTKYFWKGRDGTKKGSLLTLLVPTRFNTFQGVLTRWEW